MTIDIAPLHERHFLSLWATADAVARERRYLAMLEAPPQEAAFAFYRTMCEQGQCQVAVQSQRVLGWCDVLPQFGQARQHVGTLGMGLLADYRGQGLGTRLLQAAVASAWQRGLSRIELSVRDDNHRARALYERQGFVLEGRRRRAMRVDGVDHDCDFMALLRAD